MVLWHGTRIMGSAHMLSKEKITHKEQKVNMIEFSAFLYSAFFFSLHEAVSEVVTNNSLILWLPL